MWMALESAGIHHTCKISPPKCMKSHLTGTNESLGSRHTGIEDHQAQEDWQPSHMNVAVADSPMVTVHRISDAQNEKPLSLYLLHSELFYSI